jgi:ribonuclease R
VMHSAARLTYTEVAAILGNTKGSEAARRAPLVPHLQHLYELFQVLLHARQARGAIDFETTETYIVCNAAGKIEQILPRTRNDAHRVIEECMLAANVCAADLLARHEHPGVYRVHAPPSKEKLEQLRTFLKQMGLHLGGGDAPAASDYAELLPKIKLRPDAVLLQTMLLRSMQQAVYSPDNIGHFGLAYEAYAHFTSPIRRYPDLLTHRAIKAIQQGKRYVPKSVDASVLNTQLSPAARRKAAADKVAGKKRKEGELAVWEALGIHCSANERRADEASRDVEAWLKCYFIRDKLGEEFSGTISGVAPFGIFVQLDTLFIEGLVHVTELGADYFQYDEVRHELRGERTGIRYQLTDRVKVQVSRVDLDARKIDLRLVSEPAIRTVLKNEARRAEARQSREATNGGGKAGGKKGGAEAERKSSGVRAPTKTRRAAAKTAKAPRAKTARKKK